MTEQPCAAANPSPGYEFSATLLAMAGHDLRQPLQIIASAHEVLARSLHDDNQRKELARAEGATVQLATMLGQLVEALRLDELPSGVNGIPVSLGPIFEELAAEFAEPVRLKGVTMSIPKTHAAVLSHPALLRGMMRNLVRNAIDYTPAGGTVMVECRLSGPHLRIEVHDSGVGLYPELLSRIFRAFERADATRADGLGLGLFIVKRAADLLNHRIEVRSVVGRGSCFAVLARAVGYSAEPPSISSSFA